MKMEDRYVFLVSAMVEKPGKVGHRAGVVISTSKESALGKFLLEVQKDDEVTITSFDVTEITHVVPKPNSTNT
jgi:hypothetical protein